MITLKKYRDDLIQDLELNSLDVQEKNRVVDAISNRINEVILSTTLNFLSEKQYKEFKKALKNDDPEHEIALITAQVPGLADTIEQRLLEEYKIIKSIMTD